MTPQFLRSEAARFRDMAESSDREASRQRLLAMAVDYEAQAEQGEKLEPPEPIQAAEPEPASEGEIDLSPTLRAARQGSGCRGRLPHAAAFDCCEHPEADPTVPFYPIITDHDRCVFSVEGR